MTTKLSITSVALLNDEYMLELCSCIEKTIVRGLCSNNTSSYDIMSCTAYRSHSRNRVYRSHSRNRVDQTLHEFAAMGSVEDYWG